MTLTTVPTISAEYHKSRQILENTKAAVRDFSTARHQNVHSLKEPTVTLCE